jgi:hypothetical protein
MKTKIIKPKSSPAVSKVVTGGDSVDRLARHLQSLHYKYKRANNKKEACDYDYGRNPLREKWQEECDTLSGQIMRTEREIINTLRFGQRCNLDVRA